MSARTSRSRVDQHHLGERDRSDLRHLTARGGEVLSGVVSACPRTSASILLVPDAPLTATGARSPSCRACGRATASTRSVDEKPFLLRASSTRSSARPRRAGGAGGCPSGGRAAEMPLSDHGGIEIAERVTANHTFEAPRCSVRTAAPQSSPSRCSHGAAPTALVDVAQREPVERVLHRALRAAASSWITMSRKRRRGTGELDLQLVATPSPACPRWTQRMYGKSSMWPFATATTKREGTRVRLQSPQLFESKSREIAVVVRDDGTSGQECQRGNRTTGTSRLVLAGRRLHEAANASSRSSRGSWRSGSLDGPPVDPGDHERLVPERDDRADAVCRDELAAPDRPLIAASDLDQVEIGLLVDVAQGPQRREASPLVEAALAASTQQRLVQACDGWL